MYNISVVDYTMPNPGNALGIFEDGDIYDQADLNLLYKTLAYVRCFLVYSLCLPFIRPQIPQGTKPVGKPIDGAPIGTNEASGGGESLLDLSLAIPLIYPQKVHLFQVSLHHAVCMLSSNKDQTDDYNYEFINGTPGFLNTFFDALDGSYCTSCAFGECGNSPLDPSYPDPATGGYKGALQCGKYKPTNVISISVRIICTSPNLL
jgi:tripeptidyl-peptidase-1